MPIEYGLVELITRFGINVLAMMLLVFGLYYQRYRDKELVITAAMFNIFTFAVLTVLSAVDFSIAAGFGLFAILALFSLRSEQISKTEITYLFGCISIAVICSVQGTTIPLVLLISALVLLAAYVIDHPKVLSASYSIRVTLDKIDPHVLSNSDRMCAELSERLGVEVMSYQITALDYITDMVRLTVYYRKLADDAVGAPEVRGGWVNR